MAASVRRSSLHDARLSRRSIEKVAHRLAHSFPVERIAEHLRAGWEHRPALSGLKAGTARGRAHLDAILHEVPTPHFPSLEEIRRRAEAMASKTPSIDDIVERTREILIDAVGRRLDAELPAA